MKDRAVSRSDSRRTRARHFAAASALLATSAVVFVACGSSNSTDPGDDPTGGATTTTGTGGKTSGAGGKTGTGAGGKTGTPGAGGAGGGHILMGMGGVSTSAGGTSTAAGGTSTAAGGTHAGGSVPVGGAGGSECSSDTPDATITRKCRPETKNECDGMAPTWEKPGDDAVTGGNGFDDDCDGLVDEGCPCAKAGTTKTCYDLPSSQTTGAPDWKVEGWCDPNSKGTEICQVISKEQGINAWDGKCVGAQPPYPVDFCKSGDFDCDGVPLDPPGGCKCNHPPVYTCPNEIIGAPFPDPNNVGQFVDNSTTPPTPVNGIDGMSWIDVKSTVDLSTVKDWRWSVVGGPCDDILPNPTFALYPTNVADFAAHLGVHTQNLPLSPEPTQPSPLVDTTMNPSLLYRNGWVVGWANGALVPGAPNKVFPAFSLSGAYYVTGKFTYLDPDSKKTMEGQCTQVVKVKAPGLRVELCWPEVGASDSAHDVDLHLARMQGNATSTGTHGWFTTAGPAPLADDCYYSPCSACGNRTGANSSCGGTPTDTPGWYTNEVTPEPGGVGVCHGFGSRRFNGATVEGNTTPVRPCTSPRLDRDNIDCDPTIEDPNAPDADFSQTGDNVPPGSGNPKPLFCGPENINLDSQVLQSGDKFAIGVECYNCVSQNDASTQPAHPRVNVYCNGELQLGFGYDKAKEGAGTQYPQLFTKGKNLDGSMWQVGVVQWNGGDDPAKACTITPAATNGAFNYDGAGNWHDVSDGSATFCVNNGPLNSDASNFAPTPPAKSSWPFKTDGTYPTTANELCSY